MRSLPLKGFLLVLAVSSLGRAAFAAEPALPSISNSLPQEKLAPYHDPFNELRAALWETLDGDNGFFLAQTESFSLADARIQGGKLALETKTGRFSSVSVASRFAFRGDFDIQVDCHVDFLKSADDMDQLAFFSAVDATPGFKEGELEFLNFGLSQERGKPFVLFSSSLAKRVLKTNKTKRMDGFKGSLRLFKVGGSLLTLYRQEGESGWTTFDPVPFDKDVVTIAFGARNSTFQNRDRTAAKAAVTARFDNFRVNAAQEILGPDAFDPSSLELATLRIQNSLPEEKLARYHDAFRVFQEDLWIKSGGFFQAQSENFRLADIRIQDGRLVVQTKTGAFSSGGIGSLYKFIGDFDVQVDCRVDFVKDADDMDQLAQFGAGDPTQGLKEDESVSVFLSVGKSRGKSPRLFAGSFIKGERRLTRWKGVQRFHGSLRLVKLGPTLYAFYRNEGASAWKSLGSFPFAAPETGIGFGIRNFELIKPDPVGAKVPFTASFGNFRVNAAQKIVEPEI